MAVRPLPSGSLARRFALAAAGLAAGALLLTALASWWLVQRQHERALRELAANDLQYQAQAVTHDLEAFAGRMRELAASTILATGLVDSKGRETYLAPFLGAVRQINGIPVELLFTDFEGKAIAASGGASFDASQLAWLKEALKRERAAPTIAGNGKDAVLLGFEPLVYARTASPEGALLYKVRLDDLHVRPPLTLEWGAPVANADRADTRVTAVAAPGVFAPLQLRLRGPAAAASPGTLPPQYLSVVVITAAVFAAVVFAGMRVAQMLTRDLRRLQAFSEEVIGTTLSTRRAPTSGSDEVAGLARSINAMLDRLHAQHSDLAREGEKLAALADALRAADRRKDEFLATLAHELRNPLAPIRNSVTLMKAKQLSDPHLSWARDVIERQVLNMSRLLDDLLDISRITRDKLELRRRPVLLSEVVEAASETSRPLMEAAGHRLQVDLPPAPLWLDADPLRLSQVLSNLLNNAAKYTPAGGDIRLTAALRGGSVAISVRDNGIGIAADQLSTIFEMFVQADAHDEHHHGGLGIGLSLVRALTEMHGGTVSAKSAGRGAGSEFTVTLPVAEGAAEPGGAAAHMTGSGATQSANATSFSAAQPGSQSKA